LCAMDDPSEILAALESRALDFRMAVLAEKLLALLSRKEREALARGLVFELAVGRAVFESVVGFGDFTQAVALGLLAVSPELEVRVPRLLGLAVPQDEALAATAARELYAVWEKSESEVQRLEMHRLAIVGRVGTIAAEINQSLAPYWNQNNRYQESIVLCRQALEIVEDYRVFHSLAFAEWCLGNTEDCLKNYQIAIDLCPQSDQRELATLMNNKAVVHVHQGNVEDAMVLYKESLRIKRTIGYQQGIAATLYAIATVYGDQGNLAGAMALYEESLQIQRAIGNRRGMPQILSRIADVYRDQGNVAGAMKLYEESLSIEREIDDQGGIAITLHQIAMIYGDQGNIAGAMALYNKSLQIQREIGNQQSIAATLHQIASIYYGQGNVKGAMALYEESLQIERAIGNQKGIAATLNHIGTIYVHQGNVKGAMALYEESLQIERAIGNQKGIAETLAMFATVLAEHQQDFSTAIDYLQQSEAILRRIGSPVADTVAEILQQVRGLMN
jgi:tetratricopeptide (TPR) repeat protein